MGSVTTFTADRVQDIENAEIVSGSVVSGGQIRLFKRDGSSFLIPTSMISRVAGSGSAGRMLISGGPDNTVADFSPGASGLVKSDINGVVSRAVPGVDYVASGDPNAVSMTSPAGSSGHALVSAGANRTIREWTPSGAGIVKTDAYGWLDKAVPNTDYAPVASPSFSGDVTLQGTRSAKLRAAASGTMETVDPNSVAWHTAHATGYQPSQSPNSGNPASLIWPANGDATSIPVRAGVYRVSAWFLWCFVNWGTGNSANGGFLGGLNGNVSMCQFQSMTWLDQTGYNASAATYDFRYSWNFNGYYHIFCNGGGGGTPAPFFNVGAGWSSGSWWNTKVDGTIVFNADDEFIASFGGCGTPGQYTGANCALGQGSYCDLWPLF
jgi:hypothetical protein